MRLLVLTISLPLTAQVRPDMEHRITIHKNSLNGPKAPHVQQSQYSGSDADCTITQTLKLPTIEETKLNPYQYSLHDLLDSSLKDKFEKMNTQAQEAFKKVIAQNILLYLLTPQEFINHYCHKIDQLYKSHIAIAEQQRIMNIMAMVHDQNNFFVS